MKINSLAPVMRDLLPRKAALCAFLPDRELLWENMEASLVCWSEVYVCWSEVDVCDIGHFEIMNELAARMLLSLSENAEEHSYTGDFCINV